LAKPPQKRIKEMVVILRQAYPRVKTVLRHKDPYQLLIATILSAQCTDERVNRLTPFLFRKYGNVNGFARAKLSSLQKDIRSTGFYRNKAKNIIAASKKIIERFEGRVPDEMEMLLTLPGVARKTANIVLSTSFGKAQGIAVDTHVKRLSQRLGLSKEEDPSKIEKDLMALVPKSDWLDFNYLLVAHGRKICTARKPLCDKCPLRRLCLSGRKLQSGKR